MQFRDARCAGLVHPLSVQRRAVADAPLPPPEQRLEHARGTEVDHGLSDRVRLVGGDVERDVGTRGSESPIRLLRVHRGYEAVELAVDQVDRRRDAFVGRDRSRKPSRIGYDDRRQCGVRTRELERDGRALRETDDDGARAVDAGRALQRLDPPRDDCAGVLDARFPVGSDAASVEPVPARRSPAASSRWWRSAAR